MFRRVKVFRGVFVLRRVATPDMPAGHAQTQVDPGVANLQAVFTAVSAGRDFANLIEMSAGCVHMVGQQIGHRDTESLSKEPFSIDVPCLSQCLGVSEASFR